MGWSANTPSVPHLELPQRQPTDLGAAVGIRAAAVRRLPDLIGLHHASDSALEKGEPGRERIPGLFAST